MNAELFKLRPELEAMRRDLPNLLKKNPESAKIMEKILSKGIFEGIANTAEQTKRVHPVKRLSFRKEKA